MAYTEGRLALSADTSMVSGEGTYWLTDAKLKVHDLIYFELEEKSYLLTIGEVFSDTSMLLHHIDGRVFLPGHNHENVRYGAIQNFTNTINARLASDLQKVQGNWHKREREMTGWFASKADSHPVSSVLGEKVKIPTPKRILELSQIASQASEQLAGFSADIARNTESLAEVSPRIDTFDQNMLVMESMFKEVLDKYLVTTKKHQEVITSSEMVNTLSQQVAKQSQQVSLDSALTDIARKGVDTQASATSVLAIQCAQDADLVYESKLQVLEHANKVAMQERVTDKNAFQTLADKQHVVGIKEKVIKHADFVSKAAIKIENSVTNASLSHLLSQTQAASVAVLALKTEQHKYAVDDTHIAVTEQLHVVTSQLAKALEAQRLAGQFAQTGKNYALQTEQAKNDVSAYTQEVAHALREAKDAANAAAKITSNYQASLEPESGMTPIARTSGQIDEGWLNLDHTLTRIATAITRQQTASFLSERQQSQLSEQFDNLQRQIKTLHGHLQSGFCDNHTIDEALFTGVRAKSGEHALPIFNMTERGWLADASYQEGIAEMTRMMGGSGIIGTRQYQADKGFQLGHRVVDASYACLNIHNHPNYKAMAGMAEIAACVNGYYFRTRHNDYKLMHSVPGTYLQRAHSESPQMPESVKLLPTGCNSNGRIDFNNTQAQYMRDVKTSNPQDCIWELSYLECWIETLQDDLNDPTDSFRHSNDGQKLKEIFEKGRYLNLSGHKNRSENLPYQPMKVTFVDENGVPNFGLLQFRISSKAVATFSPRSNTSVPRFIVGNAASHYHTLSTELSESQVNDLKSGALDSVILSTSSDFNHSHEVKVTWTGQAFSALDLNSRHQHPIQVIYGDDTQLPYDENKAVAGVIDHSNQFKMIRDLRSLAKYNNDPSRLARSRMARFEVPDLERMCEKIAGLEGDGTYLSEEYEQYGLRDELQNWQNQPLNAAYYNRRYRFNRDDASGRVSAHRGFSDPTLFVAKTRHKEVVGGFSWMIPLELLLRTPRESWNPYDCPLGNYSELKQQETGGKGKASATPYSGIHEQHFYYGTPKALFTGQITQTDPADTSNTAWVQDKEGIARLLYGNGLRVHDYDGVRQRFPIYALYQDYSHDSNQRHWLRENIKDLLKKSVNGQLTITDIDELL